PPAPTAPQLDVRLYETDQVDTPFMDWTDRNAFPGGRIDDNGNVTSLTPSGKPAHTFGYSEVDLETSFTAPLVGTDRIVWGSDYPHADSTFPGAGDELQEAIAPLTDAARDRAQLMLERSIAAINPP
ncbi:MAG: hypothetical protein ACO25F_08650, partial [Erythrobacter sp.]